MKHLLKIYISSILAIAIPSISLAAIQLKTSQVDTASGAATSISTTATTTTAGNILILGITDGGGVNVTNATDTAGDVFVSSTASKSGATGDISIWYAKNIAGGANNIISVTYSASVIFRRIFTFEYSGVDTTSPLDVNSTSTGTDTNITTPAVTTNAANELLFVSVHMANNAACTAGTNFTHELDADGGCTLDRIVSATGSYGAAASTTPSDTWWAAMSTFKQAPASPGTPGTPTYSSQASSTPGSVTVNWSASTNTTYYKVEKGNDGNTFSQVATTSATSYATTTLSANTTYWYRVRGNSSTTGDGPYSASSSVLMYPGTAGTPTFTNVTSTSLTVNWTNPSGGASSTKIERAPDSSGSPGTFSQIATTTATTYNDSGLSASTTYWYRVRSTNATGDGLYSANASTSTPSNSPPSVPSEDSPANGVQNQSTSLVFAMTATDPESNTLRYKVTIYNQSGCSAGVVQTDDETSSQTGWSGQNASSSTSYTSGSQGTYTVQSALSTNTTYYWKASAIDPAGSNTFTNSSSCNSFTTTYGNWTTDSGTWSISSNQLTVTPSSGSSVQVHATGQSQTNGVVEFKAKSSAVGANTGKIFGVARADSGSNRYVLTGGDVQNNLELIGKTISNAYSTLVSPSFTFSAATFYEFRGYISGTSLQSWINGGTATSTTDSALSSAGFIGVAASSTNGSAAFTYDNFAFYTSPTVTFSSLPAGGSWAVRDHSGTVISCRTASTWDASTYSGQIPIDYDNSGGSVAVWVSNNTCNGSPDATYPSSGLATDIFGGDTYAYSTSSVASGNTVATTTITISASGLISL